MQSSAPDGRPHLGTLIGDMATRWPRDTAVVEHRGVRRYATSYAELARLARRFAAELERRGVKRGERVVLWGANSAPWTAAFFGCVGQGVLPVPLDAAGTPEFAQRVVREVSPRLVAGDRALLEATFGASTDVPWLAFETLAQTLPEAEARELVDLKAEDPLQILFTSGTTGEPKGVVHTHGNLLASLGPIETEIAKYRRYERWFHPLRFLHTLPLSHVFGQFMGLWVPPVLGATVHYESRTTPTRLLELIPDEHIHVLAAVPRTLALLRAHLLAAEPGLAGEIQDAAGAPLHRRWWKFLRLHRALGLRFWAMVCGGATLPAELEIFWTTLGFALVQGYGLTETAALVTLNHPFHTTRGSLGAPLPGRTLRVSATGELEVQGAMVSQASWQHGRMVERESPWLPTGDLAEMDENGKVRLLGRTGQRLVTAAGLNVYLRDVEDALTGQPELDEALVLAWPASDGGEEPAAVVVSRAGDEAAAQAMDRANAALAPHQRVRRWRLWPELALPRTSTGKVRRAAVENWAREQLKETDGKHPEQTAGEPENHDPVIALLRSITGQTGPSEDTARLDEDWSLDSMGRVALAAALEEQLGVALNDGMATGVRTVGELRQLVRGAGALPVPQAPASTGADAVAVKGAVPLEAEQNNEGAPPQLVEPSSSAPSANLSRQPALQPRPETVVRHRYPRWPWSWPVVALRMAFVEGLLRPLAWLLGTPRVHTHLVKGAAPAPLLLISNHRTAMDVPLLLYALPFQIRRRVAVAMSGEMLGGWESSWSRKPVSPEHAVYRRWWGPIASLLLRALLNVFPLPGGVGFRESFAHAGRALDRGYHVLIFPEGRRGATGELQGFRRGLGLLWKEAETDVLPMALLIQRTDSFHFRSRPEVHIGSPVAFAHVEQQNEAERTELLRDGVQKLLAGS